MATVLRTFRPTLPVVLATLAVLVYGPLAHALSRPAAVDSTHLVGLARLVQSIHVVRADELRTMERGVSCLNYAAPRTMHPTLP